MARRRSWLQQLFGAKRMYRPRRSAGMWGVEDLLGHRGGMMRGHRGHRRGGWLSRILAVAGIGYLANRYYKKRQGARHERHYERPVTA